MLLANSAQSAKWTRVDASYPFEIWYICIILGFMKISFQLCTWKCFLQRFMAGTPSMLLPMNFPWWVFRSWRRWIQSLSRFPERDPRNRPQHGWRYDGYSLGEMKLSVIFCFFPLKLWQNFRQTCLDFTSNQFKNFFSWSVLRLWSCLALQLWLGHRICRRPTAWGLGASLDEPWQNFSAAASTLGPTMMTEKLYNQLC